MVLAAEGVVSATQYLTIEQAQQAVFPGEHFLEVPMRLTDRQKAEIKKRAGIAVRSPWPRVWRTGTGGFFVVDQVLGKHEFITYAAGINPDGRVKQVEIMEYRESYGYAIRDEPWRRQFVGKTSEAPLQLDHDINNVSGATLSCRHITDGVKKVLVVYDLALKAPQ